MLHLFELYFVTVSKSFLFLVEDCLYVTCDPGFVIGETAYSLCRYDCISTEVDVLSKTINLSVSVHTVLFPAANSNLRIQSSPLERAYFSISWPSPLHQQGNHENTSSQLE